MNRLSRTQSLDRHALVMAIWLAFGFAGIALFSYGLGIGGSRFILAAFGAVLAAFIGHVIVNAVHGTAFTPRELALGLILYAAALIAFGLAILLSPGFAAQYVVPISLGLVAVFGAAVFFMITHFGVREAFEAFDVIRDFRTRPRGPDRSRGGHAR